MAEPILVWRFHEAPKELQAISHHGGDEDWLAEVPPDYLHGDVMWIDGGFYSSFGNDVSWNKHPTKPGWQVAIGAH